MDAAVLRGCEARHVVGVRLAVRLLRNTIAEVPGADFALCAASPQGLGVGRIACGCNVLLVALNHSDRLVLAFLQVVEIALEINADDEIISGPDDTDLLIRHADLAFFSELPCNGVLAAFHIPYPYRLVCASSYDTFRVFAPADSKDASLVNALTDLLSRLTGLAIVEPDSPVAAHSHQVRTIRAEATAIDELVVLAPHTGVELERRTVIEDHARIIAASGRAQWPLLSDADTIDRIAMTGDLSHAVSTVGCDTVAKTLFAVSYRDDPLAVAVPRNVVDPARDDMVFAPRPTFSNAVPNSYCSCDIARGYVETTGREASDGRLRCRLGVLARFMRAVDGPNKDGLAGLCGIVSVYGQDNGR